MSKEFELNLDIPYGDNRYVLMSDDTIIEIGRYDYPDDPCGSFCAGNHGYGRNQEEAYNEVWKQMHSDTNNAILETLGKFLMDEMQVEDGQVTEYALVPNIIIGETDSKVLVFPSIEKMCLAIDEEDLRDLTPSQLLDMVMGDYHDPFCGSDGRFSLKAVVDFCNEHNVDLSNTVLMDGFQADSSGYAVVYIDTKAARQYYDTELSEMSADFKNSILEETKSMVQEWNDGNVYDCVSYDRAGNDNGFIGTFYGDDAVKEGMGALEVHPVKDLGTHSDIDECLDNMKELDKSRGDER